MGFLGFGFIFGNYCGSTVVKISDCFPYYKQETNSLHFLLRYWDLKVFYPIWEESVYSIFEYVVYLNVHIKGLIPLMHGQFYRPIIHEGHCGRPPPKKQIDIDDIESVSKRFIYIYPTIFFTQISGLIVLGLKKSSKYDLLLDFKIKIFIFEYI